MLDSQSLSDPSNVVEITDNLRGDRHLIIVQAYVMQPINVGGGHVARVQGEFEGVVTQGAIGRRQIGLPIVIGELLGRLFVSRLPTEVSGMRERSVVAVIRVTDDSSQHLTSGGRECIGGFHE